LKKVLIFLVAFSLLTLATSVWAANGGAVQFKQKCGACHMKGGEAAPVNPGDKAGRVWQKYFRRGRHPVEINISEKDMDMVIEYLEDNAADSDHPEMSAMPK